MLPSNQEISFSYRRAPCESAPADELPSLIESHERWNILRHRKCLYSYEALTLSIFWMLKCFTEKAEARFHYAEDLLIRDPSVYETLANDGNLP